jgi:hypothetical protein
VLIEKLSRNHNSRSWRARLGKCKALGLSRFNQPHCLHRSNHNNETFRLGARSPQDRRI